MRRKSSLRASLGAAVIAFLAVFAATGLAGCQKFFTTSLATGLARESLPIPANLSQAADLANQAQSNPKLATALVSSLVTQIASLSPTDPARVSLQASAATAAVAASGTSSALTGILADVAGGGTIATQSLIDLVGTVKAGATPAVVAALSYLNPTGGISAADAKAAGLTATDLAIAAIVIASPALPENTDPTTMTPDQVATFQARPEAVAAKSVIDSAIALVEPGSVSAAMLNDKLAKFSLPTTP